MRQTFTAAAFLVCSFAAAPATAQTGPAGHPPSDPWTGFVAIGPGAVPEFEGSKDYELIPFGAADIGTGRFTLELRGLGARLDVLGDDNWSAGPLLNLRTARNDDIDGPVGRLDEIDTSVEAGAFLAYGFGGDETGRWRVTIEGSAMTDATSSHEGTLATIGASWALVRTGSWFLDAGVSATWADDKFTDAYFGISPAEADRTGFAAYKAKAGVKDAEISLTGGYQFNPRWGVIGMLSYSRLLGDAADSPLANNGVGVLDVGSRDQFIGGIALSRRF